MKNKLQELNQALKDMGLTAEEIIVLKNGVKCRGFKVVDGSGFSPIVYDTSNETVESLVRRIIENQKNKKNVPDLQALLTDRRYVLDHVTVAIQKRSSEMLLKKDVLNLEAFIKLHLDLGNGAIGASTKVTEAAVRLMYATQEELWHAALKNTKEMIRVKPMPDILRDADSSRPCFFWIVTLENMTDGASALLFPGVFQTFCEEQNETTCLILPSSTQELLIIPGSMAAGVDLRYYAWMVENVNKSDVEPILRLDPVVYQYSAETERIEIVAEA